MSDPIEPRHILSYSSQVMENPGAGKTWQEWIVCFLVTGLKVFLGFVILIMLIMLFFVVRERIQDG
jgi:hypothetical protein